MFFSKLFKTSSYQDKVTLLAPSEFNATIQKKGCQLIDVRTPNEYAAGTIQKAKNLNIFDRATFKKEAEKMDKTAPVYLFCQSGNRSRTASKTLIEMGFSTVFDLKGGYSSWR